MIYRKTQNNNHASLENDIDSWMTLKLLLQVVSIMVLIYCAEIFG